MSRGLCMGKFCMLILNLNSRSALPLTIWTQNKGHSIHLGFEFHTGFEHTISQVLFQSKILSIDLKQKYIA